MIATVITWIGIGIALLVLALLLIPIRVLARGSMDDREGLDYQLILDWAFGLLSVKAAGGMPPALYVAGLRVWTIPLKREGKKKPREKRASPFTWLGWIRENASRIQVVISRFARASFLRGYLIGRIGLSDPADTAFVGLLGRWIRLRTERFHLAVVTVYDYETIHIRAKIQSTLIIGYLGIVALGLFIDRRFRVMLTGLPQT